MSVFHVRHHPARATYISVPAARFTGGELFSKRGRRSFPSVHARINKWRLFYERIKGGGERGRRQTWIYGMVFRARRCLVPGNKNDNELIYAIEISIIYLFKIIGFCLDRERNVSI